MFNTDRPLPGFAVDDIAAARTFYRDVLGMTVLEGAEGTLALALPGEQAILVYPKPGHEAASFTVLNFRVDDVEAAVDDLNARGVVTAIYDDPRLPTDAKGIMRGHGPDIAWFRDPARNVLAVLKA
jgi:catechol 2,3-dioxygenase-like lactoylglutathione lyase family enzyme